MMRTTALIAVLAAAFLAVAGCGGDNNEAASTSTSGTAQQTITISETEYTLDPSTVTVDTAGTYTVEVSNDGQATHALEIEGNGMEEKKTGDIAPGDSASVTVDLEPGEYEMYCPIGNHKELGMEGTISVSG